MDAIPNSFRRRDGAPAHWHTGALLCWGADALALRCVGSETDKRGRAQRSLPCNSVCFAGIMSRHIHSLAVGDKVSFVGPKEKLAYRPNMVKKIGLVAGGTGLTPMLQLIELILSDESDSTELHFLYLNTAERDILLRDKLDGARSDETVQNRSICRLK